jgi:hypothetical protein
MRRLAWRRRGNPEAGHPYLVFVGVLVLDRLRTFPEFFWMTWKVRRQLRRSEGLAGYALHPRFRTRTFTAVAAWRDPESLHRFTTSARHAAASGAMGPHMSAGSKFVTYELYGEDLPPKTDDIVRRLEAVPGLGELDRPAGEPVAGRGAHHPAGARAGAPGAS